MGKMTMAEAEALQKDGTLPTKTMKALQKKGIISSRKRGIRKVMKTADGKWVTPQLYYQGLNGGKYSKKMTEFRDKFNKLCNTYTTEITKSK